MDAIEREPWWQERAVFIRSRPSVEGLGKLARAVSRGSSVVRVRRLGGGLATATSTVTLRTTRGKTIDVVLKRFPRQRHPYAKNEWQRIVFAERLPIPTPEAVAFDARGEWFGAPAIVMSKMPGRPDVAPKDHDRWVREFAGVQATIHSVPLSRAPKGWESRDLPAIPVEPASALTEPAKRYITRRFARARKKDLVIGHGDAHPGNVLWLKGRISGVTDWHHAGVYPRGHEAAYSRADIAVLTGPRIADRYLDAYEDAIGFRVPDLPMWDLRQGLAGMRWSPLWALAYREQGATLTAAIARRRAESFTKRVLTRLEH